jgi:hypothetical protein
MDKVERPMWSRVGLRYTTNIDGPKFESPERGELGLGLRLGGGASGGAVSSAGEGRT